MTTYLNREAVEDASTGFNAAFVLGRESASPLYPAYCFRLDSSHSQETLHIPEGLGGVTEWIGPRKVETPFRWVQTLKNKTWSEVLAVPVEAYEDDEGMGVYRAQAQQLGVEAELHPDELLTSALVNGFTRDGYDEVAFFSASHPRKEGLAVQSNLASGALAANAYRSARAQLLAMTNWHGKSLRLSGRGAKIHLMYGPSNEATARSIVSLPTTASGAGNPDYQTAQPVLNEELIGDYANYWFLLVTGMQLNPFVFQMRVEPEIVATTDPQNPEIVRNGQILHAMRGRWNLGYFLYQLAVGSTGS